MKKTTNKKRRTVNSKTKKTVEKDTHRKNAKNDSHIKHQTTEATKTTPTTETPTVISETKPGTPSKPELTSNQKLLKKLKNLISKNDSSNNQKIKNYEKEIADNLEDTYKDPLLYELPLSNICNIMNNVEFDAFDEPAEMIQTIIRETGKSYSSTYALLLHSISVDDLNLNLELYIQILGQFSGLSLCKKICETYNFLNTLPTIDYEHHIECLEDKLNKLNDPEMPVEFNPIIHDAAASGNIPSIKYLLQKEKADINEQDKDGDTPLHMAIRENQLETVKFLCQSGADVEKRNFSEKTPLILATFKEEYDIIRELVTNFHANVNAVDQYSLSPLFIAIAGEHLDIVKFLCENDADVSAYNTIGETPLITAIKLKNFDIVKELVINYKADVNQWSLVSNDYPLHIACKQNSLQICQFLCDNGADIEAKNQDGDTPLNKAVKYGFDDIIVELVEVRKANINAQNERLMTPLHYAALYGDEKISQSNQESHRDRTDIVVYLLDHGADSTLYNNEGKVPYDIAKSTKNENIQALLDLS